MRLKDSRQTPSPLGRSPSPSLPTPRHRTLPSVRVASNSHTEVSLLQNTPSPHPMGRGLGRGVPLALPPQPIFQEIFSNIPNSRPPCRWPGIHSPPATRPALFPVKEFAKAN